MRAPGLDILRRQLLELILSVSYEKRVVTLSNGEASNFCLDLRNTMLRPLGQKLVGELLLAKLMAGPRIEAIGGMVVAAVPVVTAVLAAAVQDDPDTKLLGFFVRKEAKKHGTCKQIEGAFAPGQTVALVDDTMTTGGSTLEALRAVSAAGGNVKRVLCIVDRGEGAAEAFAARGLELEALFTRKDLPG